MQRTHSKQIRSKVIYSESPCSWLSKPLTSNEPAPAVQRLDAHPGANMLDGATRTGSRVTIRRICLIISMILASLGSVVVLTAAPASAATCYGRTCNDLNPQAAGCGADAQTLDEITVHGTRIELRYSPSCWAAWARSTNVVANSCGCVAPGIYGYVNGQYVGGRSGDQPYSGNGNQTYTVMLSFSYYVQACASGSIYSGCTALH